MALYTLLSEVRLDDSTIVATVVEVLCLQCGTMGVLLWLEDKNGSLYVMDEAKFPNVLTVL